MRLLIKYPIRVLFVMVAAQAAWPAFAYAQELKSASPPPKPTPVQHQPLDVREPYPLRNRGDIGAAINLVKPLAEAEKADISTLVFLCSLYEEAQDFKSAVEWYRRAITKAGKEVDRLPWNLHGLLGTALLMDDRDHEAIPELELGLRHYSYSQDDPAIYRMLAVAYQSTGAVREAKQAYLSTLSVRPSIDIVWTLLENLNSKTPDNEGNSPLRPGVPRPPTTQSFSDLIALGNPSDWSIETLRNGISIYAQYAEYLDQQGRRQASGIVRRAATRAAVRLGAASYESNEYEDCIRAFAMIEGVEPIAALDPELQQAIYKRLLVAYGELEQYVHSIAMAEQYLSLLETDEERRKATILLGLTEIYRSVSWEKTGILRENDPDDFVGPPVRLDTVVATKRKENLKQEEPRRHSAVPNKGNGLPKGLLVPYGMVSPSEDSVTLSTSALAEEAGEKIEDMALRDLAMLRIRQQNFEFPVKYFLFNLEGAQYSYEHGEDINIDEQFAKTLEEAILKADSSKIRPSTLEAFAAAKRIMNLLKRFAKTAEDRTKK